MPRPGAGKLAGALVVGFVTRDVPAKVGVGDRLADNSMSAFAQNGFELYNRSSVCRKKGA